MSVNTDAESRDAIAVGDICQVMPPGAFAGAPVCVIQVERIQEQPPLYRYNVAAAYFPEGGVWIMHGRLARVGRARYYPNGRRVEET